MSRTYIPKAIRERVAREARYRCGYCQTQQKNIGLPMHVDHIIPESAGGISTEDNLWLACALCNNYKGTQTHALDPVSQRKVPLFNPRTQAWYDHFVWSDDGTEIIGLTPTGRATVIALKMNQPFMIHARRRWMRVGWHPPRD
jgi:hypothetical protein